MREIEEIYEELMEGFAARAGVRPDDDCDLAVRLYAAAAQIQALSIQTDWVLSQSFPQTAQGEFLDSHAQLRGLTRTAAVKAVGTLRFEVDTTPAADLTVPAGTVCMTAENVRYQTLEEAVLPVGELAVETAAEAVEAGAAGNTAAHTVVLMAAMPGGIVRCTNPTAFVGGREAESDESLRSRVLESYQRLPNGANAAFYEQVAMGHQGVAAAVAVGRARGIGTVDVYVSTPAGLPSAELLEEIRADLQAKREIAVDVQVLSPAAEEVAVTAELLPKEGVAFETVETAAREALENWFTGEKLGQPVHMAELTRLLYEVDGVENCHLLLPEADLAGDATVLPRLGTVTLTEMEG